MPRTTKVVAGMATVAGVEDALRRTLATILPQVDELYLYLNKYEAPPSLVHESPKIRWTLDPENRHGARGKFWGLNQVEDDAIYLSVDDDIEYPKNYVATMTRELAAEQGRAVVGVHSELLAQPRMSYYHSKTRAQWHFKQALERRRRVHILGTATTVFHSSVVHLSLAESKLRNLADLWMAQFTQANRIPMYAVARKAQWLVPIPNERPTIYGDSTSRSGSQFDHARAFDEALTAMCPISILRALPIPRSPVSFLYVPAGVGVLPDRLQAQLQALAKLEPDPVVIVFSAGDHDVVRETVLQPLYRCEVHAICSDDSAPTKAAYGALLDLVPGNVKCLRYAPGSSVGGAPMDPNAWRPLLLGSIDD